MSWFCKHKWTVQSEYTSSSKMEQMLDLVGKSPNPSNSYQLEDLLKRSRIVIMTCNKCGKVKKFKDTI